MPECVPKPFQELLACCLAWGVPVPLCSWLSVGSSLFKHWKFLQAQHQSPGSLLKSLISELLCPLAPRQR